MDALTNFLPAWPWALGAAAVTVPLLVLLYFLKLRRRTLVVSSTLLWRKAIQDLQVNTPFQRLRRNLLLFLQLLVLLALLLALGRPQWRGVEVSGRSLVLIIDHSASMSATDLAPSRLEQARRWAWQQIDSFDGSGGVMVVSCAQQARVVQAFTRDKALAKAAVASIQPTDQPGRLGPALALIEPFTSRGPGQAARDLAVYVVSDGRFTDQDRLSLEQGELVHVQVGTEQPDNLAIVAASARRDFARPQNVQVFARVVNYGPTAVRANLTLAVEGQVLRVTALELPGRPPPTMGPENQAVPAQAPSVPVYVDAVIPEAALLTWSHDHADALAADNAAAVVLAPARQARVLLVGDDAGYFQKALRSAGVRKLEVMSPGRYEDQDPRRLRRGAAGAEEGYDALVFLGHSPSQTPPVDAIYFGAAPPVPGLKLVPPRAEDPKAQRILDWRAEHPLLQHVNLRNLVVVGSGRLALPDAAEVLATARSGPVMAEVTVAGTRQVVAAFNFLDTDLAMQWALVVVAHNIVHYLNQSRIGISHQTGQAVEVGSVLEEGRLVYRGPRPLEAPIQNGVAVLPVFEQVGVYEAADHALPASRTLAVNLADPVESDLAPVTQLAVNAPARGTITHLTLARRDIWPWFLVAAVALLMLEWVVYTRRMGR